MVSVPGLAWRLEAQGRQALPDPAAQVGAAEVVGAVEIEEGVALAGEAVVELHHGPAATRIGLPERGEGTDDVLPVPEVLVALREEDAGLAEDLAAAGLGAEVGEGGVAGVQGNAQLHGEGALVGAAVEADEVRERSVGNRRPNALDQPRPGENLGGERLLARVAAVQEDQPLAGVRRRHAGEEVQEVVDHDGIELLAGDEDHAGARPAQQHEHVEHALFVVVHPLDLGQLLGIEAEAGHHHHRLLLRAAGSDLPEQVGQAGLELCERGDLFGGTVLHRRHHSRPAPSRLPRRGFRMRRARSGRRER